jgi:hypothetical protein
MIEEKMCKVWYSSLRNRRFFSKDAAIKAEAIELYKIKKYEQEGITDLVNHDIELYQIKEEIKIAKESIK